MRVIDLSWLILKELSFSNKGSYDVYVEKSIGFLEDFGG